MFICKKIFVIVFYLVIRTYLGSGQDISYNFNVLSYDLLYEIDSDKGIFNSVQDIGIENASANQLDRINFLLHPDLLIGSVFLQDSMGENVPVVSSKIIGTTSIFKNELQIIEVQTEKNLDPGKKYKFHMECIMKQGSSRDSVQIPYNPLDLIISSEITSAIGPHTGHFAIFNRNIIAPFQIRLKFPEGKFCCVPGNLISSEKMNNYVTETYNSNIPNIPTFSCASYDKIVRRSGDKTFEFYLYPGQPFVDEMADIPAMFVNFYTSAFGDIGTDIYRFGNIGSYDSKALFLENKGNTIYLTDLLTRYFTFDEGVKSMFSGLVSHELFHNWNIFSTNWTGQLTDWFEEGGANFIAAMAGEKLFGEDFGISGRIHFISSFAGEQGSPGYESKETLESVQKTNSGDSELMLIYYYGALVWEQLRQKVGDEALYTGLADFFSKYRFESSDYQAFLNCLQATTSVNVEEYLNQWIKNNAKIDLMVKNVSIMKEGNGYRSDVEIMIESDRDYELMTAIGYKTSPEDKMELLELHPFKKGIHKVSFQSMEKPVFIQVDPACRVPQINLDNNIWSQ